MSYDVVVIGSGLAGLTASLKLSEKGLSVVLVEKEPKLGGNSMKASSGINGVPTKYQHEEDSTTAFKSDTLASGKGMCTSSLVDALVNESAAAIEWLTEECKVDLSFVTRLGGHSYARTHRGSGKLPPGFAIISSLTKRLSDSKTEVLTNTKFENFLKKGNEVAGVAVTGKDGPLKLWARHVVLATGGFLADTGQSSFVERYRPELSAYPSTNGPQTTGDGQGIAYRELGAELYQMDQIQVHPTGFVQLKDGSVGNKHKFLCGELIRGIGGILISSQSGERFVNELETRDVVTQAIVDNCGPERLAIIAVSEKDYPQASSHIDFYMSQQLMFKGTAVDVEHKLKEYFQYETKLKGLHDKGELYFGFVVPVLHFAMGGIKVNDHSQVISDKGTLPNVFAIGEVSAGVHGANRLAGSSLLECVVFGTRVAGHICESLR